MKIYNEIILKWNDKTNRFDTVYEDSYKYNGPIDLASPEDIDFGAAGKDAAEDFGEEFRKTFGEEIKDLGKELSKAYKKIWKE